MGKNRVEEPDVMTVNEEEVLKIAGLSLFLRHGPYHQVEELSIEECIESVIDDYGCSDIICRRISGERLHMLYVQLIPCRDITETKTKSKII